MIKALSSLAPFCSNILEKDFELEACSASPCLTLSSFSGYPALGRFFKARALAWTREAKSLSKVTQQVSSNTRTEPRTPDSPAPESDCPGSSSGSEINCCVTLNE